MAYRFLEDRYASKLSPSDVHELADKLDVKWDNEPSFLAWSKELTGKEHLDDMNQAELKKVLDGLSNKTASGVRH